MAITDGLRKWAKGNKIKTAVYTGGLVIAAGVLLLFGKPEQADVAYKEAREFTQTVTAPDGTTTTSTTETTTTHTAE